MMGELQIAEVALGDDAVVIGVSDLATRRPAGPAIGAAAEEDDGTDQAGVGLAAGDVTTHFRVGPGLATKFIRKLQVVAGGFLWSVDKAVDL